MRLFAEPMHEGRCGSAAKRDVRHRLVEARQHLDLHDVALHGVHGTPDGLTRAKLRRQLAQDQVAVVHAAPGHLHEVLQLLFEAQVDGPLGHRLARQREVEGGDDSPLLVLAVRSGDGPGRLLLRLALTLCQVGLCLGHGDRPDLLLGGQRLAVVILPPPISQHPLLPPEVVLRVLRAEVHLQARTLEVGTVQLLTSLVGLVRPRELGDDHVVLLLEGNHVAVALQPHLQVGQVQVCRQLANVEGVRGLRSACGLLGLASAFISASLLLLGGAVSRRCLRLLLLLLLLTSGGLAAVGLALALVLSVLLAVGSLFVAGLALALAVLRRLLCNRDLALSRSASLLLSYHSALGGWRGLRIHLGLAALAPARLFGVRSIHFRSGGGGRPAC
mmetsp:Transcript_50676/g.157149  ORF Transcript_50676/g.157149 Transcript_50676/m.157149 type:complete len:388 (+) Transcript_50676:1227-2390(+)